MGRFLRGGTAVAVFAVALVMAGRAPGAWACSCIEQTRSEQFERADVVFSGTVTEKRDPHGDDEVVSSGRTVFWTFDARAAQKGEVDDPQDVRSVASGASCGYVFDVGRRYQVFADRHAGGNLWTDLCSGTHVMAARATPFSPVELPTTGLDTKVAVIGGLTLIVGAGAIALRMRRSSSRSRRV